MIRQLSLPHAIARSMLALIVCGAFAVRVLRLSWQPFWWDEGYSIYFATEPIQRMVWLTAHDIHPPLYYLLLHSWIGFVSAPRPELLRLASVFLAILALPALIVLGRALFPRRRRVVVGSLLLLALNPLHLYYSQEVRMYGLSLVLGLLSTWLFWRFCLRLAAGDRYWRLALAYVLVAALALYSLYYLALLLMAQFIWAVWHNHRSHHAMRVLATVATGVAVCYLPWLIYAGPKLLLYVQDKVVADQDESLSIVPYLYRHLLAFTGGHIIPTVEPWLKSIRWFGLAALLPLVIAMRNLVRSPTWRMASGQATDLARTYLWTILLISLLGGFLVNLAYPFFPDGGERLLLFVLPYFLLLVLDGVPDGHPAAWVGRASLVLIALASVAGIAIFYSQPRYVEQDYRPVVAEVTQLGAPNDTVLATFPWQIGYWRAYSPQTAQGDPLPPQPAPLDQTALQWTDHLQSEIDTALSRGIVWFPAPLAFGSTLPGEIEAYFRQQSRNFLSRWTSSTTHLSAWSDQKIRVPPEETAVQTRIGPYELVSYAITPRTVPSANSPIAISLVWRTGSSDADGWQGRLRLVDDVGTVWAERSYPLFAWATDGQNNPSNTQLSLREEIGLIVPAGLPPGAYRLVYSLIGPDDQPHPVAGPAGQSQVALGDLDITLADAPLPPARLPIQIHLMPPLAEQGLTVLGVSGITDRSTQWAGTFLPLSLFMQSAVEHPSDRAIYLVLSDRRGNEVAAWDGWPLSTFPPSAWPVGTLIRAPVSFYLPPTLEEGTYQLRVGYLYDGIEKSPAQVLLPALHVVQRPASFVEPEVENAFDTPVQFGTHVLLLGYGLEQHGDQLEIILHWQVLQTLLPPHHIFVHLDGTALNTLAQQDGPPVTELGPAPTSSWRAGEFLTTRHALTLPSTIAAGDQQSPVLNVGLYLPSTGARLPASIGQSPAGDQVAIPLPNRRGS